MTKCDGPNCVRAWKKLPKRGFVLSSAKGKRYRFCTLGCLEQALVAGLGVSWHAPSGKRERNFKERYWQGSLKRVSQPPFIDWPRSYEDALKALAELRDAIKPGRLDRMLDAACKEIRRAARKLTPPPPRDSRYGR